MPISQVNGVRIYWQLDGDIGQPLVLVHGSWGDHRNWDAVVPSLSGSFRVLSYDRRGHSQSERREERGSVHEDVRDLAALLEELGLEPAHVVGNSFGGSIALRLAAQRPELVRSVIVHEPPLFGLLRNEPGAAEAMTAVRNRISDVVSVLEGGRWSDGARQFVETIAFGPGAWAELPEEIRETFIFNAPTWLDEAHDPDALELNLSELRAFSAPALLTMGDQSAPFFPLVVRRVAMAMPHASQRTYPGAGHVPHLSHPEHFVRVVTEFAKGVG